MQCCRFGVVDVEGLQLVVGWWGCLVGAGRDQLGLLCAVVWKSWMLKAILGFAGNYA